MPADLLEPSRPAQAAPAGADDAAPPARIAVIGAGFSGVLTAIHLLWRCRPGERVYLVEKSGRLGRGIAYGTSHQDHVLNVRASNMSAFADDPGHFTRWLERLEAEGERNVGLGAGAGAFARRELYGRYVQSLLSDAVMRQGGAQNFFLIDDEAVGIVRHEGGLTLKTGCGRDYEVDAAVLAVGNFPADSQSRPGYAADPWDGAALAGLDPKAPLLLLGTGLTMVDSCTALWAGGHEGPITALSRRGRLPQPHRAAPLFADFRLDAGDRGSVRKLTRAVRREVARAAARGIDWRGVMDALRPHVQMLWQELPLGERERFLRHVRSLWDVHRHRMAPAHHEALAGRIASGGLEVRAGRLQAIEPVGNGARVTFRPRGREAPAVLEVARVINCSGLGTDVTRLASPLLSDLLGQGLAAPDALRLGLATSPAGALVDGAGRRQERLFAVGPVTRGTFWEITSVPDIRAQAEAVALNAIAAARGGSAGVETAA